MSLRPLLRRPANRRLVTALVLAIGMVAVCSSTAMAAQSIAITPCSTATLTPGQYYTGCSTASTSFPAGGDPGITTTVGLDTTAQAANPATSVAVTLQPGVLANLNADTSCITPGGTADASACLIGGGTVNASGGPIAEFNAYLTPATTAGDLAGIDLVVPAISTTPLAHAEITLAQLADGSVAVVMNLNLATLDADIGSLAEGITGFVLNLNGTLNSTSFLRMPTNCGTVADPTSLTVVYGTGSTSTSETKPASQDVAATGCSSLTAGYTPTLTATAVATSTSSGYGVALDGTVSIANPLAGATTKDVTLTLPSVVGPNLSIIGDECSAANVATCPTATPSSIVGTASAVAAVLPTGLDLTGDVVIVKPASGIYPPDIAIVATKLGSTSLTTPIVIKGTTNLLSSGADSGDFQTIISGVPDIPLSSLSLDLANTALTTTCSSTSGSLTGAFTDQNGDPAVNASAPFTITGCKASTTTPPPPATTAPKVSGGSISGLTSGSPKLGFTLTAASSTKKLVSFTVSLPSGLSFIKSGIKKGVSVSGAKIKKETLSGGKLVVTLKSGVTKLSVKISSKALKESAGLKTKVKKKKIKSLVAKIAAKDSSGKVTTLSLKLKV